MMVPPDRDYRLLIVDDDDTDRRLFARLLMQRASGHCEIVYALDGAAGLRALRNEQFDCVLLDFSLPDMSGLEFLADAAVDNELPCAVVLVTGQGNEAVAVEAMKRGVQDYLVKDKVSAGSLWRALTAAVSQTALRQRLASSLSDLTAANIALEQEVTVRTAAEAELRTAKEIAEQADQAKTRFVAMVTHELRTPLNGILGYAQLLRIEGGLSTHQNARVGSMMQAGQHLLEMIEGVLDFASIESGRMELHPVPVSVRDLTEGCIAFVGPVAGDRGLSLRLVSSHDAPRQIMADPARLRQILLNLLGNAVKFTESGGVELRLLGGATPGTLRIEVVDTGPGIREDARERLFKDFERIDASASVVGAGLGLAIASRFVALMGGAIGHRPNPGGGSIFWLELPQQDLVRPKEIEPEEDTQLSSTDTAPVRPALSGKHILLVDDIAMNRDVIGAFLRAAGHEVILAENGQTAVRLAAERTFDLILMDIRMPEMDGLEATRRIRALAAPKGRVPVLALTACSFPDQVAQCQEAGMDGHVPKPVDYASLMYAVADAIERCPSCWTAETPAPPVEAAGESPIPELDRFLLGQVLMVLPPDEVVKNLQALRARKEQMLALMDARTPPEVLTQAAHGLASTAGMFGFTAVSMAARRFEHAMESGEAEAGPLAQQVRDTIATALTALDGLLVECQMQPA